MSYLVVAVPAGGTLDQDRYYLNKRGFWVHGIRSGEARRFTNEDVARETAAEKQKGLSTRIVEVISA